MSASIAAAASPATAAATVTIGSNLGRAPVAGAGSDYTSIEVAMPPSYLAPGGLTSPVNGTVTVWRIRAGSGGGSTAFQVVHPLGGNLFTGAGTTPLVSVPPNAVTPFSHPLPIAIGDSIGARTEGPTGGLIFTRSDPVAQDDYWIPGLQDGGPGRAPTAENFEITFNADITPTNTFSLGTVSRNKKKGTATLNVTLPNPGDLTASGNGVKAASAGRVVISKSVGTGPARLLIKAKGKKKATLDATGKVKLNVSITYTPTGGDPSAQSVKVKLKKGH